MNDDYAPIIVFAYNRSQHLLQTLNYLVSDPLSKKSELYIFCDGPKKPNDICQINEIKSIVSQTAGFKSVVAEYQQINLGLANSVIYGVTKILNIFEKAIVVEDDILIQPGFLSFMNDSLSMYAGRKDIFSISGYNYPLKYSSKCKDDYYLSYRSSSWGWATWKDRWEKVDWAVTNFSLLKDNINLKKKFERGGEDLYPMLASQLNGKIDSWSIRFDFAHFENDATALHPKLSLVQNIGFDGSGTHDSSSTEYQVSSLGSYTDQTPLIPDLMISKIMLEPFNRKFRPVYSKPWGLRYLFVILRKGKSVL